LAGPSWKTEIYWLPQSRGFDAFITTDKNLRYQQNLRGRRLAILVLPTTNWLEIQKHVAIVSDAVNTLKPGDFVELEF